MASFPVSSPIRQSVLSASIATAFLGGCVSSSGVHEVARNPVDGAPHNIFINPVGQHHREFTPQRVDRSSLPVRRVAFPDAPNVTSPTLVRPQPVDPTSAPTPQGAPKRPGKAAPDGSGQLQLAPGTPQPAGAATQPTTEPAGQPQPVDIGPLLPAGPGRR